MSNFLYGLLIGLPAGVFLFEVIKKGYKKVKDWANK